MVGMAGYRPVSHILDFDVNLICQILFLNYGEIFANGPEYC
jgi:hypothetical protein